MTWYNHIVARRPYLSPLAGKLAAVIDHEFASGSIRVARFYDVEAAAHLDTTSSAVRHARHELMREGLLVQMQDCSGKPGYSLRRGAPAHAGGDDAA
jgi:hypothetical protein